MNYKEIDVLWRRHQELMARIEYARIDLERIEESFAGEAGFAPKQAIQSQIGVWEMQLDQIELELEPSRTGAFPDPANEAEFQAFMDSIDRELSARGVPNRARTLEALRHASMRLKIGIGFGPLSKAQPTPGSYRRADLTKRIVHWMDDRYGDRLKVDLSIGRAIAILRGDAWLIRVPYMAGRVRVIADRDLQRKYPHLSGSAQPADVTCGFR